MQLPLRPARLPRIRGENMPGESPPDPAAGDRRFFYAPELTKDHLYRGVATAAYGDDAGFDLTDKVGNLRRLQADGFWLIDQSDTCVDHLPSPERRRLLRAVVPELVDRAQAIAPVDGVIVCMTPVFTVVAEPLRRNWIADSWARGSRSGVAVEDNATGWCRRRVFR